MFSQPHTGEAGRYERAAFETIPRAGLRFAPLGGQATSTLAALEAAVLVLVAVLAMTALIVSAV